MTPPFGDIYEDDFSEGSSVEPEGPAAIKRRGFFEMTRPAQAFFRLTAGAGRSGVEGGSAAATLFALLPAIRTGIVEYGCGENSAF